MKTAREQLFDEVTALLQRPAEAAGEMKKIMGRYRVQTKPGVEVGAAATARDALGDRLVGLIKAGGDDEPTKQKIGTTIDEFRMQLKQASDAKPSTSTSTSSSPLSPSTKPPPRAPLPAKPLPAKPTLQTSSPLAKKPATSTTPTPPTPSTPAASAAAAAAARPAVTLGVGEAPARPGRGAEPVAGGPRARKKARAECPKCKSMGVVLARSYSGDEYYSCIYCGWQAYKPADEDDPNASLALRLLGQSAGTE